MRVGEAERMATAKENYSVICTSKLLEEHGRHVEHRVGIYWWGEGQESHHNNGWWICDQVRSHAYSAFVHCCRRLMVATKPAS